MASKLFAHLRRQWMGALALFLVLSGGTAVALDGHNTVFSDDIVDGEVYSADVRNDTLNGGGLVAADLRKGSVGPSEIANAPSGSDNVNADRLDGFDASELEDAHANAVSGGSFCPGDPVVFCQTLKNRSVAYVVKVAEGVYCVGVDGVSAVDHVALVEVQAVAADAFAIWRSQNSACVSQEFEIVTGTGSVAASNRVFTIVIP